jgi:glucosyl-dolichyl phosphate glucuronosyltransferase
MQSDTTVVICTYTEDRWDTLLKAIESVEQQVCQPDKIIVVVDHNRPLFERLRAAKPSIRVIENTHDRGLSGARNSGVMVADGIRVAFLDDDAEAAPEWLEVIDHWLDQPEVLGAGGSAIPSWEIQKPGWFPMEFAWVIGCSYIGMPESAGEIRNLLGVNMGFRKELFSVAGGFRSSQGRVGTVPLGCEETDFCIRAHQLFPTGVFIYDPAAIVHHHVSAGRLRWGYFISRCYHEGLSKSQLAQMVGAQDGLKSERTYTSRILPRGVVRNLGEVLLKADPGGLGRIAAIIVGLTATTLGYVRGYFSRWPRDV